MKRRGRKEGTRRKLRSQDRKNNERGAKKASNKSSVNGKKVFIYALALGAVGGAVYLTHEYLKRKKNIEKRPDDASDNSDTIIINNTLPASYRTSSTSTSSGSSSRDSFPLKRGSRGQRVLQLQQALASILGASVMNANGGVDGVFGAGTSNALKQAGYSEVINETLFNTIIERAGLRTGAGTSAYDPKTLARDLYKSAQVKNLEDVLVLLKRIRSASEYSSVSEHYKKLGFISRTVVTDLLDYAFKTNEGAKQLIRNEFLRMGLKVDASGKWSVPTAQAGLSGRLYKDLITLRDTLVIDSRSNRIPVRKNTILGEEFKIANGMTWFRSVDKSILQVPTQDVTYT